jgi:PAS domain S-box-containing protein
MAGPDPPPDRLNRRFEFRRYGVAVVAVAVAVLVKLGLDWLTRVHPPYAVYLGIAVAISGYFGGLGPALLATVLSIGISDTLATAHADPAEHTGRLERAAVIAAEGVLMGLLGAAIHRARRREARSATDAAENRAALLDSQRSLRDTVDRESGMVEAVRDYAIFLCGPDGKATSWNVGAERTFGYAEAEIVGQDGRILFTPEDRAAGVPEQELQEAAREGRASDDRWMMRKDGTRFFASGTTTALRDESGRVRGFTKVCRDRTDAQRQQEERERLLDREQAARREADAANRLKDEFLAIVSHELRTPLAAILLWARMLRGTDASRQQLEEGLHNIEQSAKAQQQLIEDLLDLSRMTSGRLRLDVRDTDLAAVVLAALDAVRPMADARGVRLQSTVDSAAGAVRADPNRIQQIVWNLMTNGVKFTPAGGTVALRLERRDHEARITVSDTGRGIEPEFLPFVFDPFRQGEDPSTRRHGGLGLGLAIARQLAQLHGGTIRANSPGLGQGATFTVELPFVEIPSTAQNEDRPAPRIGGATPLGPGPLPRGLRVLLVEDEAATRKVIQWLLEQSGAKVTAAASADEALERFGADGGYDLLLSDIAMPGTDGYELIRQVRDAEQQSGSSPALPAIALTAYARDDDRAKALSAGFAAHIAKPVEPEELLATVLQVLKGQTPETV